jgi:hypothetical protein
MDVKDVQSVVALLSGLRTANQDVLPESSTAPQLVDGTAQTDTVTIISPFYGDRSSTNAERAQTNDTIEAVHVALRSLNKMDRLVQGLAGLTELASADSDSERKLKILEAEGRGLHKGIQQAAQTSTRTGLQPFGGDPIRLELERTLAPVLEMILPNETESALGISEPSFASKDMILATAAKIESAKKRVQELRSKISDGLEQLAAITTEQQTSFAPIRPKPRPLNGVETALSTSWSVKNRIGEQPARAIESHGISELDSQSLLD